MTQVTQSPGEKTDAQAQACSTTPPVTPDNGQVVTEA